MLTSLKASVLDLHEKFPLKNASKEGSDTPWRVRALQLEETLDSLKRKHAEDLAGENNLLLILSITVKLDFNAELDIFRANACAEKSSNSSARNGVLKKKRKLNAATAVGSEAGGVSAAAISASSMEEIRGTAGNWFDASSLICI